MYQITCSGKLIFKTASASLADQVASICRTAILIVCPFNPPPVLTVSDPPPTPSPIRLKRLNGFHDAYLPPATDSYLFACRIFWKAAANRKACTHAKIADWYLKNMPEDKRLYFHLSTMYSALGMSKAAASWLPVAQEIPNTTPVTTTVEVVKRSKFFGRTYTDVPAAR